MEIKLSLEEYEKVVIEKTLITFKLEYQIDIQENNYVITISDDETKSEFFEDLFFNDLRFNIAKETNTIKKLIIGRALNETCIRRG